MMPCKPSENFRKVKTGDIIDEEKSVRWNREEVERLKEAYGEEVKRLNREKNALVTSATDRAIRLIAEETGLCEKKARLIFEAAPSNACEMFSCFE